MTTRRALLLGAQAFGLRGVPYDLDLVEGLLDRRGFDEVVRCEGDEATFVGMRAALDGLVARTRADDQVVLYYSGHGARVLRPDAAGRAPGQEVHVQYLVPIDLDASTDDEFRGVLSAELSEVQRRLTGVTPDVTTILDCCHSGGMARDPELLPRAVHRDVPVGGLRGRLQRLPDHERANELAVRLVAAEIHRPAYEGSVDGGEVGGLFTSALVATLDELGERRLPWRDVVAGLRARLDTGATGQRPAVEGPVLRHPFSLTQSAPDRGLPVRGAAGRLRALAGVMLGLGPGDEVRLRRADDDTALLETHVVGSDGVDVLLRVTAEDLVRAGHPGRAEELVAVPLRTRLRQGVVVDPALPVAEQLRAAVGRSPRLQVQDARPGALRVRAGAAGMVVEDAAALPARTTPLPLDAAGVRRAVDLLELLAKGERVKRLAEDPVGRLEGELELELALVAATSAEAEEFTASRRLHGGDRLRVLVRNRRPTRTWVWLFDVGVSGRVSLVSNDLPDGRPLEPSGQLGDTHAFGGQDGIRFSWPADVPDDRPRLESLLLVAADSALDLSPLVSGEAARTVPRDGLRGLLAEALEGRREAEPVDQGAVRSLVLREDVLLVPGPRVRTGEPAFELDDRPDPSVREAPPQARGAVPARVAVRLLDLVVRKNRALFDADVRLDWLVVTGDGQGGARAHPDTQRFPRIGSGERLPADRLLLFEGPVHDYLDLALWVSRDDERGQDLLQLFQQRVDDTGVQTQLAVVAGLVVAAPQAAAAVGVVAAVSTLVQVGGQLVAAATGKDIGLYRASWLPFERFGVGRVPRQGLRQAQDVDFALEILDVGPTVLPPDLPAAGTPTAWTPP